jgi:heme oxygenase
MLSEKLKELTKASHQSLERKMVSHMRSIKNVDDYATFLSVFYSFFGGMEQLIDQHLDQTNFTDYNRRRKAGMLADDLISLTGATCPLASISDLPVITNNLQSIGAMYVMEGSTLGGQIISKMIAKQLGVADPVGMSYFNGYGDQTLTMWNKFKQDIDGPYNDIQQKEIIKSANDTFMKFDHLFDGIG